MSRVRSKNTGPELIVRRMAFKLGYRYRLHGASLPGRPDMVFAARRKVIFVHGCFWHRHARCPRASLPKSRTEFWEEKFQDNVRRDRQARRELSRLGWKVLVVWECETTELDRLAKRLREFLG